jgi:hypothetical protein
MMRVLPLTSPVGFALRQVWGPGPRCRRLGAQVSVTRLNKIIGKAIECVRKRK